MDEMPQQKKPPLLPPLGVRGFTMVELMIVVVLIAALAALSTPSIMASMERNRINQMNRDIANAFLAARSHAMRQGQAVFVQVNPGDDGSIVFFERVSGGMGHAPTCLIGQQNSVDPDDNNTLRTITAEGRGLTLSIANSDPDDNLFCISPTGRVTHTNGLPIVANATGCGDMNLLLAVVGADSTGEVASLRECTDDIQKSIDREVHNFSMIHVAYGGQVRVIR